MPGKLRVALDWTPNILHVGLFVAQARGYYGEAGIEVELLPPGKDYSVTPAKRVEREQADLAICPSESCIAYAEDRLKGNRLLELQAIYAILQIDASAIVTTKPDFSSCSALQNGVYGSYGAKYEDSIVRKMINNAGGDGDDLKINKDVNKLTLFDNVKAGKDGVDATWIFLPWEGVEARRQGIKLNAFRPTDYQIPYGYSPVIARDASKDLGDGVLEQFVKATAQGYAFAMLQPSEAVDILAKVVKPAKDKDFLTASLELMLDYLNDGTGRTDLGVMRGQKWHKWVDWMKEQGLVKQDIRVDDLYTNEFFGFRRGSE